MTRRRLQLTKTLEMDPKFVPAQHAIEAAYAQNGMFKEAVGERQKVLTLSGNPDLAASIGEDFNASGYPGVMKSSLEGLKEVSKRGYVSSYNMAQIYARLGDKNQALAALEQAYHDRDSNLTYVKVEPAFDDLRSDPRFQKIVQQLALPQLVSDARFGKGTTTQVVPLHKPSRWSYSAQRITWLSRQTAIHPHYLRSGLHILTVDERDRARNGSHQLVRHVIRIDDFGSSGRLCPENFRNPVLFELRFRHLVDDFQDHVPLPGHGGPNQQDDRNVCAPILTVAEKDLAHLGQAEVADRRIGVHHDRDVNVVALGCQRLQKRQAQAAENEGSRGEFPM